MTDPGHVTRVEHEGREIYIVGTAHISQKSVEEVERTIAEVKPDTVCVELDQTRYDAMIDGPDWRGELRIPWRSIGDPEKKLPVMLRFNFAQHVHETGESTSWAGPVDFGRDDAFMGLLVLREPQTPGMIRAPGN